MAKQPMLSSYARCWVLGNVPSIAGALGFLHRIWLRSNLLLDANANVHTQNGAHTYLKEAELVSAYRTTPLLPLNLPPPHSVCMFFVNSQRFSVLNRDSFLGLTHAILFACCPNRDFGFFYSRNIEIAREGNFAVSLDRCLCVDFAALYPNLYADAGI